MYQMYISRNVCYIIMSSVQTQTQSKKGELIGEVRGKNVTTTIKDVSPFGVRLQSNGNGECPGRNTASEMETVNVSMDRNGVSQFEARVIQTTKDGEFVSITSRGNGKAAGPTT